MQARGPRSQIGAVRCQVIRGRRGRPAGWVLPSSWLDATSLAWLGGDGSRGFGVAGGMPLCRCFGMIGGAVSVREGGVVLVVWTGCPLDAGQPGLGGTAMHRARGWADVGSKKGLARPSIEGRGLLGRRPSHTPSPAQRPHGGGLRRGGQKNQVSWDPRRRSIPELPVRSRVLHGKRAGGRPPHLATRKAHTPSAKKHDGTAPKGAPGPYDSHSQIGQGAGGVPKQGSPRAPSR